MLAAIVAKRTTRDWLESLEPLGIPCGAINNLEQVFDDPQVKHRAMRIDLPHARAGTAPGIRNPALFSRSELQYRSAAPLLGEHTDTVLATRLGIDARELDRLRDAGVIR